LTHAGHKNAHVHVFQLKGGKKSMDFSEASLEHSREHSRTIISIICHMKRFYTMSRDVFFKKIKNTIVTMEFNTCI